MSKEVIASDIDEVLFPFVQEFAQWHNRLYGTRLSLKDFHSYEFDEVLNISVPETVKRVHDFLEQEHKHLHVSPIEQAQEAIRRLSKEYELVFITARHPCFREITEEYLEEYFSDVDVSDKLYHVGHAATMEIVQTKVSVCKEIGARALIDDSVSHVSLCPSEQVEGILFGEYSWNSGYQLPLGVTRCINWSEVEEYFNVKAT